MQGQLSEIDIRSILQLIELGQRTGELFVETYVSVMPGSGNSTGSGRDGGSSRGGDRSWFVFFLNGEIIYATHADGSLNRLQDYLYFYHPKLVLDRLHLPVTSSLNAPEYSYLWALLENRLLTPAQAKHILQAIVHETLFDLLSLHQGVFVFETGSALVPQLTTLTIGPLVTDIMKQIQAWKQFHPYIQSPDQKPLLTQASSFLEKVSSETTSAEGWSTLIAYLDGKSSLRQLSRRLNREILIIARQLHPYVQQGLIQMLSPFDPPEQSPTDTRGSMINPWQTRKTPRVVCIDDGLAVRVAVESILQAHGYEVASIGNPLKALSLLFHLKPDLILCDITMPELDGYEICAMLRNSTLFRQTPIIMLTGKEGFIDRVHARMVGATDYLTKPFCESELLMLIEKYAGPVHPLTHESEIAWLDYPKGELELEAGLEGSTETFPTPSS